MQPKNWQAAWQGSWPAVHYFHVPVAWVGGYNSVAYGPFVFSPALWLDPGWVLYCRAGAILVSVETAFAFPE